MTTPWIPASLFCLGALAVGVNVGELREEVAPKTQVAGLEAHETHAAASLLGQFRSTISGNLWLRADLYLHNGVQMRPLTEAEIKARHKGSHSADGLDNHLHGGGKTTTVIPSAEEDFRGVLGDMERATKAYKDMTRHEHNSPQQSLPLFRLMTWIDPHFIRGWTAGAHILAMEPSKAAAQKAVAFLEQGLEHNPDSPSLNNQLGFTYVVKLKDFRRSIIAFQRAIDAARPVPMERLSQDDQESLLAAYRWLALCYRSTGRRKEMYAVLREGIKRFPDDVPLHRMANDRPTPLLPLGEAARLSMQQAATKAKRDEQTHNHDHAHGHHHHGH